MEPTLILFTGLPGCGKTTLARQVAHQRHIPLLAKDRLQRVLRDHIPAATGADGYHLILDLANEQLGLGISVILDAVFPQHEARQRAQAIAADHSARLLIIHCICSDEALWRERLATRPQVVPGWPPVGWEEVERLRPLYQPWELPTITIDAINPLDTNLAHILTHI